MQYVAPAGRLRRHSRRAAQGDRQGRPRSARPDLSALSSRPAPQPRRRGGRLRLARPAGARGRAGRAQDGRHGRELSGTDAAAQGARRLDDRQLDALPVEFRETVDPSPLGESMLAVERANDHLGSSRRRAGERRPTSRGSTPRTRRCCSRSNSPNCCDCKRSKPGHNISASWPARGKRRPVSWKRR